MAIEEIVEVRLCIRERLHRFLTSRAVGNDVGLGPLVDDDFDYVEERLWRLELEDNLGKLIPVGQPNQSRAAARVALWYRLPVEPTSKRRSSAWNTAIAAAEARHRTRTPRAFPSPRVAFVRSIEDAAPSLRAEQ
jgi:hypothetical protein